MWHKYIQGIALVLAGIVTMSMRVVASIDPNALYQVLARDVERDYLNYNPLTYIIGALLIIAGGFSIYTAYKEDKNAN